jgi:hypothetical protein
MSMTPRWPSCRSRSGVMWLSSQFLCQPHTTTTTTMSHHHHIIILRPHPPSSSRKAWQFCTPHNGHHHPLSPTRGERPTVPTHLRPARGPLVVDAHRPVQRVGVQVPDLLLHLQGARKAKGRAFHMKGERDWAELQHDEDLRD